MPDLSAMEPGALLDCAEADAHSLLAAASTRWDAAVPHCPGWDAAELVRHQGNIFTWMATVVTGRQRVSRRDLDPGPADSAELPGWYLGTLDHALGVLRSADPQSVTWTFSSTSDQRVAWWDRRLAVEVAIHRFDAEHTIEADGGPRPAPMNGDVSAAGIEEFLTEFLPGLLAQAASEELKGTLHLHATDGPVEWWIDLDAGGAAMPQHAKADTAIRGTRSDLLLWLTNRCASESLEILGQPEIADRWQQLRR
jgi:hypothetical protein